MSSRRPSLRLVPYPSVHAPARAFASAPPSANASEVSDPYVARALEAMRAEPAKRWTLRALARTAGLSRAAFARRFVVAVGRAPIRWLAAHRLDLARARLLASDEALAGLADAIGYASEFAFAKAFKRHFGVAPGVFRRRARTAPGVLAVPAERVSVVRATGIATHGRATALRAAA